MTSDGVTGATLKNVTADGHIAPGDAGTQGVGARAHGSANVTLDGIHTTGNQWGSVGLYPTNGFRNQQVTGITFTGAYTHDEAIQVYQDDASATQDLGSVTFPYAQVFTVTNDQHRLPAGDSGQMWMSTYYFGSAADALAFAAGLPAHPDRSIIHEPNGHFLVGQGMSIQTAIDAAGTGDVINITAGTLTRTSRSTRRSPSTARTPAIPAPVRASLRPSSMVLRP